MIAFAVAVMSRLVGPSMTAPLAGLVMAATGVPKALYTTMGTPAEVVFAP